MKYSYFPGCSLKGLGRAYEESLLPVMKLFLKTNWLAALGNWRMGIDLLKTGRMSLATEKIEHRADISRMLEAVDADKGNHA